MVSNVILSTSIFVKNGEKIPTVNVIIIETKRIQFIIILFIFIIKKELEIHCVFRHS